MDTPRRLQVASIATAVAGLGLGSLMVGRSPSIEVAPIDLDTALIAATTDDPSFDLPLPDPPEIVVPRIREDRVDPADDPTPDSLASPEAPAPSTPPGGSGEATEPVPSAPSAPAVPQDSPGSVDSPDSVDSVDD